MNSDALFEAVPKIADMDIELLEDVGQNYMKFAEIVGQHLPADVAFFNVKVALNFCLLERFCGKKTRVNIQ